MKCKHPETQITAVPTYFADDDVTVLLIAVRCLACRVRFRFLGLFGVGQIVLCLLQLLLEKESPLRCFPDGEMLGLDAKLINIAVG